MRVHVNFNEGCYANCGWLLSARRISGKSLSAEEEDIDVARERERGYGGRAQNDLLRICDLTKVLCNAFFWLVFKVFPWLQCIVRDLLSSLCNFSHLLCVFWVRHWLISSLVLSPVCCTVFNCVQLTSRTHREKASSLRPSGWRTLSSDFCISMTFSCPLWILCSALCISTPT